MRVTRVMVHPDDMNLADAKAAAARYDATVVGNRACPRGKFFLMDGSTTGLTNPPVEPASEGKSE